MPTIELRNLLDKDALMHSISQNNEKLQLTIKELSELGESDYIQTIDNSKLKKSLLKRLRLVLHGLQG